MTYSRFYTIPRSVDDGGKDMCWSWQQMMGEEDRGE